MKFPVIILSAVLLLITLSREGRCIPRLDDMNSFLGESFTLTCPDGSPPFKWFKGNTRDEDRRVGVAIPYFPVARCEKDFEHRDCSISNQTGDLTLGSVRIEDEGPYVCRKGFIDGNSNYLRRLNVNVNPTSINMLEIKYPKPGEEFRVTCTVARIRPADARVYFRMVSGGEKLNGSTWSEPNGDGTFKLTTTMWHRFERDDYRQIFRCIVQPQNGRGTKVTKDRRIFVTWQYKTDVHEVDVNERPIAGQSKSLSCYNSEENKGTPEAKQNAVQWIHDGHTVRNDDRHDGASTRTLTINQLQESDSGKYRCAIRNDAGPGESVSGFTLTVWFVFTSKLEEASGSEVPVVGSTKQLVCYPEKYGFPEEIKAVWWYKDGQQISVSEKYQISAVYLYINNLERSDAGEYACHLVNDAGEGTSAQPYSLDVYWPPVGQPEINPSSVFVGVKSSIRLKCNIDQMDEGNPPPSYTIWTKEDGESYLRNITGTTLQLSDFKRVTDGDRFYCQLGNTIGTSSLSLAVTVIVEAPVYIEELHPFYTQTVVYNDTSFEISCTASGSNINNVTWYKDNQPMDEEYFQSSMLRKDGNFNYGQTQAVKSVIRRKPENHKFDCDNVEYYSGEYKCKVEGMMAGIANAQESEGLSINTIYPAFWAGKDKLVSASRYDKEIQIQCNVCAEPSVTSFGWEFQGEQLRTGIERNGITVTIDTVQYEDFGVYTCFATSYLNGKRIIKTFDIELTEKGPPYEPKDFTVEMETSISVTVRWKAGFAAGYGPQTFKLEYKEKADSDFQVYKEAISETEGWMTETILPLGPSTEYEFRLRATNKRPVMPNFSQYVSVKAKTKVLPKVQLIKVHVTETEIWIQWEFDSVGESKQVEEDQEYSVGVQIKYKKESDKIYLTYPQDGRKLPPEQNSAVINGMFDVYETYTAKIVVFENDLQVESFSTESLESNPPLRPSSDNWATIGYIGGTIAAGILLLVAVILAIGFYRRRTKNTDNNRVSIRRELHFYEEINLSEMVSDPEYEDVDIVSDNHPPPVVPRTDLDADGYLELEGQGNDEHALHGPAAGNDNDGPLSEDTHGYLRSVPDNVADSLEDERHDAQGYLKPVPGNDDTIESQYLTPPLSGATANPYSTPYDHVSLWQKALQSKMSKR